GSRRANARRGRCGTPGRPGIFGLRPAFLRLPPQVRNVSPSCRGFLLPFVDILIQRIIYLTGRQAKTGTKKRKVRVAQRKSSAERTANVPVSMARGPHPVSGRPPLERPRGVAPLCALVRAPTAPAGAAPLGRVARRADAGQGAAAASPRESAGRSSPAGPAFQ